MARASSMLDRGLDAFERRDWKRARRLLEDARQEDTRPIGHYYLGLLYWRGLGGPADKDAAAACFARGAAAGLAGAQTAYGIALRSGVGVAKDAAAALAQFRSAAGADDPEAMVQLATMSEPEDAKRWLTRASNLGHAPAMLHLADMLMARNPVEALAWLYASVAIDGADAARRRAAQLAEEMNASEIDEAQKLGRARAKEIQKARGAA